MKRKNDIKLNSVPLHCLNNEKIPIGIGTGFIIDMPDCDYLLTAHHVINNIQGDLGILREFLPGKGPLYVVLKNFSYPYILDKKTNRIKSIVDFAYKKIPCKYDYSYQELIYPGIITISKPIKKFKIDQIKKPDTKSIYSFAGHTKPCNVANIIFDTVLMEHFDYKYIRTDELEYVFKPPIKHPGDDFYSGCSGAPIVDEENNLVSLLIRGDQEKDEIYGINFELAVTAFKIDIGYN